MRVAIISDIHANLEAFLQVLADIDKSKVDEVICLGDNVGYGPDPEQVIDLVRARNIPCIMGNHELGVMQRLDLAWFNSAARESVLLTQQLLSAQSLQFITHLPATITVHGCLCVHGCPPNSISRYLFQVTPTRLESLFRAMQERICFVGHTHDLELIHFDGEHTVRSPLRAGCVTLKSDDQYIINVGSVGQPRDGNNNAKYVIWDIAGQSVEVKFIPYDISVTADKILRLGFPEFNARRLW